MSDAVQLALIAAVGLFLGGLVTSFPIVLTQLITFYMGIRRSTARNAVVDEKLEGIKGDVGSVHQLANSNLEAQKKLNEQQTQKIETLLEEKGFVAGGKAADAAGGRKAPHHEG